jgi:hypothetical protein
MLLLGLERQTCLSGIAARRALDFERPTGRRPMRVTARPHPGEQNKGA